MSMKHKLSVIKAINLTNEKVKRFSKMFENEHRLSQALSATTPSALGFRDPAIKEITCSQRKAGISDEMAEILAIEKLDEYTTPTYQESGLVERLQQQREEKHTECLYELKKSLRALGLEFQNEMKKPIDEFKHNQELNKKRISDIMNILKGSYTTKEENINIREIVIRERTSATDEVIYYEAENEEEGALIQQIRNRTNMNESQIRGLWEKIDNNFDDVLVYINKLYEFLLHIEDQHLKRAKLTLQSYHKKLTLIGHLAAEELDNLISSQALIIEAVILNNRRLLSDVNLHLAEEIIFDEQKYYFKWQLYWEKWQNNLASSALHQFKNWIKAISEGENGFCRNTINKFNIDENLIFMKRMEQLYTVRTVKLPKCGSENITMWKKSLKKLAERHENLLCQFNEKLTIEKKEITDFCATEITKIKQSLLKKNICNEKLLNSLIDDHHKTMTDEHLIELNIYLQNKKKEAQYRKDGIDALEQELVSFLQATFDIWEQHQMSLHEIEKTVQRSLDKEDKKLAILCKEQEDRLTLIVDQLREANSNDELQAKYSSAYDILSEIHNCYIHCHQAKVNVITGYPKMISNEVATYKEKLKLKLGPFVGYLLDTNIDEDIGKRVKSSPSLPFRKSVFDMHKATQDSASSGKQTLSEDRKQLEHIDMNLSRIKRSTEKGASDPDITTFLGNSTDLSWAPSDFSVTTLHWQDLSESHLNRLYRIVAVNFAVHFGQWILESAKNSQHIKEAKFLELNNELELQLRLHEPRASRIKTDVLEVRASELVFQLNRVKSHIQGIHDEFEALQQSFKLLKDHQHDLYETLDVKLTDFEERCRISIPTNIIPKCRNETLELVSRTVQRFYSVKDEFSSDLQNILSHLKLSNEVFMKSFRKIQHGGTFNEAKMKEYENQLRKIPQVIQEWENLYQSELQTMENDCITKEAHLRKIIEEGCETAAQVSGFLENLSESFRAVQLSIKIEVKNYNKEGAVIHDTLQKLKSKFNIIKDSKAGNSLVTLEQLLGEIHHLMTLLQERGLHLGLFKSLPLGELTAVKSDWHLKPLPDFQSLLSTSADTVSLQGLKSKGKDNYGTNTPTLFKIPVECYIFGEKPATDTHFLPALKSQLFKVHCDLLSLAENFYKHKNQITIWPNVLSEYLSDCCILITVKFKNYWDQIEDYYSKCAAELGQQLLQLDKLIYDCSTMLFHILSCYRETILNDLIVQLKTKISNIERKWSVLKDTFTKKLRPHLGHPSENAQLQEIIDEVNKEFINHIIEIAELFQVFKNEVIEHGQVFVKELNRLTQCLFDVLDNPLVKGNFPAQILNLVDSRYLPNQDLQSSPRSLLQGPLSTTNSQWPNLLDYDWKSIQHDSGTSIASSISDVSPGIDKTFCTSKVKTAFHTTAVKLRDEIYKAFQENYIKCIKEMEADQEQYLTIEKHWVADWMNSTENLKKAYVKIL